MRLQKLLRIVTGLFFLLVATVGLVSVGHPIILKWIAGTARVIGKPTSAVVYTDGQINSGIEVFTTDKNWNDGLQAKPTASTYLLSLKEFDIEGKLKFININLGKKWIGRPVGVSKTDYDDIGGYLFQSDVGGHFISFSDDMKGYDFDPQLSFTAKQIKFRVPPNRLRFDSVRIELK